MAVLAWLWLSSPFVVIAVIGRDERLLQLVTVHYDRCRMAGCAGVGLLCLGAALMPSAIGTVLFVIGAPLVGLVVWLRPDDGEGGGPGGPEPPVDWDDFERSFWAHVRGGGGRAGPRAPAAR